MCVSVLMGVDLLEGVRFILDQQVTRTLCGVRDCRALVVWF